LKNINKLIVILFVIITFSSTVIALDITPSETIIEMYGGDTITYDIVITGETDKIVILNPLITPDSEGININLSEQSFKMESNEKTIQVTINVSKYLEPTNYTITWQLYTYDHETETITKEGETVYVNSNTDAIQMRITELESTISQQEKELLNKDTTIRNSGKQIDELIIRIEQLLTEQINNENTDEEETEVSIFLLSTIALAITTIILIMVIVYNKYKYQR